MIWVSARALGASIATLVIGIGLSSASLASDLPMPTKAVVLPAPSTDTWTFSLAPYAWATALSGSTTVRGRTADIDASFIDILDHTQFPKGLFQLAAFGEARYGRLGILADIAYMKLGIGASLTRSRGVDKLNAAVGASAGLTIQMVIAEVAAAYEVARWGAGSSPGSGTALDLYAGGRVWWQQADAHLSIAGTVNIGGLTRNANGTFTASGDVSWIDPVVGLRVRHEFAPGIDLSVSGDVGGFGVGSKFSWQAIAALNYEFLNRGGVSWSGMIGYKALSVDYSQGSGLSQYEFDMTMHGPIFGVTARF
jgi:hypothetical protein